jgi:hypothetical protein
MTLPDVGALLSSIAWPELLGGAALSALTLGLRAVMVAPIKAATDRARFISLLSLLSPQRSFGGVWTVEWHVDSTRFQPINTDEVAVRVLFGNVTFTTRTTLKDGSVERCVFVGKLEDRTLTGRWYDPKDEGRGYFGVFQVRLVGTLREATGSWSGWTNDGRVQSNVMTMKRVG